MGRSTINVTISQSPSTAKYYKRFNVWFISVLEYLFHLQILANDLKRLQINNLQERAG